MVIFIRKIFDFVVYKQYFAKITDPPNMALIF